MKTPHHIAAEIDRCLSLSLSNYEFEIIAEFISDSEDFEQTGRNLINCGVHAVRYVLLTSR